MTELEGWQLEGSAPELYERHLVPAVTAPWAADLADRAALRAGERVLDVACGSGVVARVAAERVGETGRVAALDLNPGMLAVARSLPVITGAVVVWHEGRADALPFPAEAFDVVLCQLGLQFFPDRSAAVQEMRRVLVPDGRLALNVFGPITRNPATHALAEALDRRVRPGASATKRAEHSLADEDALRALVVGAGFQDVVIQTVEKLVRFLSVEEYVRIQLAATPLASMTVAFDAARRDQVAKAIVTDVARALASYVGGDGLTFPQEVHVVTALNR